MIEPKKKKCKGTKSETRDYGCGVEHYNRVYGLCPKCYIEWCFSNKHGREHFEKLKLKGSNIIKAATKEKDKQELNNIKSGLSVTKSDMWYADLYFSRYIRLKYSKDGYCTCFTSGEILPIKEIDNGHYMKREHKSTRYHEDNCRPQSKTDNGDAKHNGKQVEFRVNLINEIGLEKVEAIEMLSKQSIKANHTFYKDIADKYRVKVNELQKEMGVKIW